MRSGSLQNLELGRADSAKPPREVLSADAMDVKERQTQCLPYWRPGRLGEEGRFSTLAAFTRPQESQTYPSDREVNWAWNRSPGDFAQVPGWSDVQLILQ